MCGRMLFLGLGRDWVQPCCRQRIGTRWNCAPPYKECRKFEQPSRRCALERLEKKKWTKKVFDIVEHLKDALQWSM